MAQHYDALSLFIGGDWIGAAQRDCHEVVNPATGEVAGRLPLATKADLDRALATSAEAFQVWRKKPAYDRAKILKKAADLMRERTDHIATQLTIEEGKPFAEAKGEVIASIDILEWSLEEGRRAYGRVIPGRMAGHRSMMVKEPVGPVAAFTPWNFPALTPMRKIATSLASGCSCIIKPAEETPGTALAIARCLDDAGLPKGALNVVFGNPAEVSSYLIASPVIRKVSFTGSTAVGKLLMKLAADGVKRTTMELGGHAPVIVFDDADVEKAVPQAVAFKYRNAGQVCISPTRFYVQEKVYPAFVEKFTHAAQAIKLGNGLEQATGMGPLANPRRIDAMEQLIGDAKSSGARVATGGHRLGNVGNFWQPTVLAEVPEDSRIMNVEPFGAVAVMNPFKTFDEVIGRANRLPFGLAAYAFTGSAATANALSESIESGMVGINTFMVSLPETPFGGVKESGFGSEGGIEGNEAYLATKFVSQM
ncbi:MAG: NAD-dependent succinate-semialdehyde dehydrogenase [Hyphomicrobiales bacterium]